MGYEFGDILPVAAGYIGIGIIWILTIFWVWQDADDRYDSGVFWGLFVLVLPYIGLPIYLLMRMGTHRSVEEDLRAWEHQERRNLLGRNQTAAAANLNKLVNGEGGSFKSERNDKVRTAGFEEGYTIGNVRTNGDFKPFRAEFASAAEAHRKKHEAASSLVSHKHSIHSSSPAAGSRTPNAASSYRAGHGDRPSGGSGTPANSRYSWRQRKLNDPADNG